MTDFVVAADKEIDLLFSADINEIGSDSAITQGGNFYRMLEKIRFNSCVAGDNVGKRFAFQAETARLAVDFVASFFQSLDFFAETYWSNICAEICGTLKFGRDFIDAFYKIDFLLGLVGGCGQRCGADG